MSVFLRGSNVTQIAYSYTANLSKSSFSHLLSHRRVFIRQVNMSNNYVYIILFIPEMYLPLAVSEPLVAVGLCLPRWLLPPDDHPDPRVRHRQHKQWQEVLTHHQDQAVQVP